MYTVECRDLEVAYGEVLAVRGVSFSLGEGEIYGLLGPNGAGKTSIIRALTTIIEPSAGTAVVSGHPLDRPMAVRRAIGVLPESNGYPSAQTALGYLRFYGQLFGFDADDSGARAECLLALLGLGPNRRQGIGTFSRGMRQRLGLARALINDPDVLFLDEPTLGLDPAGKEEVLAHLATIAADDGTTIVLCTHLLDEVERVCDRVGILHEGRIVVDGTVDEVIAASGIGGTGRIRVPPSAVPEAVSVISKATGVGPVRFDNSRPGDIEVDLPDSVDARNAVLRALLDSGIDVRSVDVRGARLSEAFLALTGAAVTP